MLGKRKGRSWLLAAACVVAAGCASGGGGASVDEAGDVAPDALQASVPARSSPNRLTGDEVRATTAGNLYDAVRRLRPQWLRARGASSIISPEATEAVVYVSGIRQGDLRTLQNIGVDSVNGVEFIDARDATTRWGTGHGGGVILVDIQRN
jgi:hypothetical protein